MTYESYKSLHNTENAEFDREEQIRDIRAEIVHMQDTLRGNAKDQFIAACMGINETGGLGPSPIGAGYNAWSREFQQQFKRMKGKRTKPGPRKGDGRTARGRDVLMNLVNLKGARHG
jgi:hypothetical protein